MYDSQPIFNIIDSSNLQDRRELKLVLIHTANARRNFAQKSLIAAQRSWINLITDTDVPIDPPQDEVVKRFCEVAGCPGPTDRPFDIPNVSLMYVYCSFQEMRGYAQKRFYDGASDGGAVISTVPPYAEGITKQTMRLWQKNVYQNTSNETHDLDAYIAFLPSTSLQNPIFSHMKIGGNSFLAPSRIGPICVEIIAVGKTLFQDNGLKKEPKMWCAMAFTSLWERFV